MGRRQLIKAFVAVGSLAVMVGACSNDETPTVQTLPVVLEQLLATPSAGGERTKGDDHFEVWICHVPPDSTAAIYGGLPLRLPLTPKAVSDVVNAHVPEYFEKLSHGRYRPVFTPGGEVTINAADEPQACVDGAIAGAGAKADAVLVVADAEHGEDQPGGFGSGGDGCPTAGACSVAATRRVAYVGASDFHPDWGNEPPMDLVEHEIGHSLGWVHSGIDEAGRYLSGLDLMSNSAAPRDVDPTRRDAPGTLAVNLFLAGWLPAHDVVVATGDATLKLSASSGDEGARLLVIDQGDGSFLTVELLKADGFDDHLPADGIAVHELRIANGALSSVTPLVGGAPFMNLLQPGDELRVGDWTVTVSSGWTVSAAHAPVS